MSHDPVMTFTRSDHPSSEYGDWVIRSGVLRTQTFRRLLDAIDTRGQLFSDVVTCDQEMSGNFPSHF